MPHVAITEQKQQGRNELTQRPSQLPVFNSANELRLQRDNFEFTPWLRQSPPALMRSPASGLAVNQPGDQYEQEADQVADQVMRMRAPARVQRSCATCNDEEHKLQRKCEHCEEEEEKKLQRSETGGGPAAAPSIVHQVLRSPGQPLDAGTRAFMEPRFGHSFGKVRVHTDPQAGQSAAAVNARAYTVGQDLVFAAGQYAPHTERGQRLLAHELTHAIQQGASPIPLRLPVASANHSGEQWPRNADSSTVSSDHSVPFPLQSTPVRLACGPKPPKTKFAINSSDMKYLEETVVKLIGSLDEKTQKSILSHDTVALGLVVDPDGDPHLVYTVAQNRTYPKLRTAADKLGITRWEATPRAEGRGKVGAPGDAEQIMFEAADTNGFTVEGMAVTRALCPDCKAAVSSEKEGGVPVVKVSIPLPPPGQKKTQAGTAVPETSEAHPPAGLPAAVKSQGGPPPAGKPEDIPKVKPSLPEGEIVVKPPSVSTPEGKPVTLPKAPEVANKLPVVEGEPSLPKVSGKGIGAEGPEVGGGGGSSGIAIFHILLLLGQMIPDPGEETAVQEKLNQALSTPQSLARVRELQTVVAQSKGFLYYNIRFKLLYTISSSPKPQAFPNHQSLKGADILAIDLGTTYVAEVKDLDPPGRPDNAKPIFGGGFYWDASRTGTLSMQVFTGEQTARGAEGRISVQELQGVPGLTSASDIRKWIDSHEAGAIAEIATDQKIRMINRLLNGWVRAGDLQAIKKICSSVKTSEEGAQIRRSVESRWIPPLRSGQRNELQAILNQLP